MVVHDNDRAKLRSRLMESIPRICREELNESVYFELEALIRVRFSNESDDDFLLLTIDDKFQPDKQDNTMTPAEDIVYKHDENKGGETVDGETVEGDTAGDETLGEVTIDEEIANENIQPTSQPAITDFKPAITDLKPAETRILIPAQDSGNISLPEKVNESSSEFIKKHPICMIKYVSRSHSLSHCNAQ